MKRALLALGLVLLLGVIFHANGAFFHAGTHRDALRQASVFGILACGMTLVVIVGGIDLAVGSVLGLTSVAFSMFSLWMGWPPIMAIPLTLLMGAGTGAVTGWLVSYPKFQPFIASLVMMVFARGLAKSMSGGVKVSSALPNGDYRELPPIFKFLDSRILGDSVAVVTVLFLLAALISGVLLSRHVWGRDLYAIGGNEEAARLSGIRVQRAKMWAYVACGILTAVAGICQAAQEQQGDPEAGAGYELSAISIVVIGGTNLMGGRGSIWLTVLGTLTIGYLEKILSINAVPEASRLMLTGGIIVAAVLAQRRR